ncbi:MAG: tetratricopeptide repeat protein, partial [Polyangiaceae bacterium]|nr:tetratricopeptide repeat protein [Polyangiaceae bacterium]
MSGRIVTFYSWKGGVGRTMALANAGVQLARRGKRVLLVDWDLEAPGLDRYFVAADRETASRLSLTKPADATGLLGLLTQAAPGRSLEADSWRRRCIAVTLPELPRSSQSDPPSPKPQPLDVLSAGLGSVDYTAHLQSLSWEKFFAEDGGGWLERLRTQWRESYEFVLIDSRTGLTDSGGVCTVQMPDALVFAFTANRQSLDDGLTFLQGVQQARASFAFERPPLTVIPLLARWEGDREVDLADAWLERIKPLIAPLVDTWLPSGIPVQRLLERLRVPHVARFSFGEPLPVLTHSLSDPDRPGLAYDLLAEILGGAFADAGRIIDPRYRPPFDPMQATEADIDALVRDDDARETATRAVAASYGDQSPTLVALLVRLAEAALRVGRLNLAEDVIGRAVSMARAAATAKREAAREKSALVRALLLQADTRRMRGSLVEAMLGFREALDISRTLAEADPSNAAWQGDLSVSQEKIGDVLRAQGDLGGALAVYRESLTVRRRLAQADSSNAGWQRDLSVSHNKVGDVLRARGDLGGALAAYRESLPVRRRLAEADPSNAGWQRDLSVSHNKVGDVLRARGELGGALAAYRESLAVRRRLAEADPSNAGWQRDLSVTHERLGDALRAQGNLGEALASYRESLAVRRRLAEADSSNAGWQRDLSVSQSKIGDVLRAQGDLGGALAAYREVLAVSRRLAEADPSNAGWQRDLSVSQERIGDVL